MNSCDNKCKSKINLYTFLLYFSFSFGQTHKFLKAIIVSCNFLPYLFGSSFMMRKSCKQGQHLTLYIYFRAADQTMFTFRKKYFLFTVLLLIVEVLIALFLHDRIIRPYIGDLLVVILLYCFARSFFNIPVIPAAIAVLIFAYLIEFLQYVDILHLLELQNSKAANIIMGNLFEWIDMIAYTLGIALVLLLERTKALS